MNAVEFVKKFGIELCANVVCMSENHPDSIYWSMITETQGGFIYKDLLGDHNNYVLIDDLKQIVEAFELVESYGGLCHAKANLDHMINCKQCEFPETNTGDLKQAINLVEQCQ